MGGMIGEFTRPAKWVVKTNTLGSRHPAACEPCDLDVSLLFCSFTGFGLAEIRYKEAGCGRLCGSFEVSSS
jgi:hypothetical protein